MTDSFDKWFSIAICVAAVSICVGASCHHYNECALAIGMANAGYEQKMVEGSLGSKVPIWVRSETNGIATK
jgi:hypothetical protein